MRALYSAMTTGCATAPRRAGSRSTFPERWSPSAVPVGRADRARARAVRRGPGHRDPCAVGMQRHALEAPRPDVARGVTATLPELRAIARPRRLLDLGVRIPATRRKRSRRRHEVAAAGSGVRAPHLQGIPGIARLGSGTVEDPRHPGRAHAGVVGRRAPPVGFVAERHVDTAERRRQRLQSMEIGVQLLHRPWLIDANAKFHLQQDAMPGVAQHAAAIRHLQPMPPRVAVGVGIDVLHKQRRHGIARRPRRIPEMHPEERRRRSSHRSRS